ncbi:DNA cytosine methyltransferase [Alteromonas lipotrueae]|uniref:DNA cytosine methyltransferase n=1 Tax=Alteromonas lipotrueae TaxID=2803814 RepID=UPI001C45A912|nr:DNA cytosine methyltransferase [Alteromonas lipotrueae]
MNHVSLSNYSKKGEVPTHIAIIASLMSELVDNKIDPHKALLKIKIPHKMPRGRYCDTKSKRYKKNMELFSESQPSQAESYINENRSEQSRISPKIISLFSGCGGMDLGFTGGFDFLGKYYENLGFDITWANELNSNACKTYRENLGKEIVEGDIWDVMDSIPGEADIVIGGFPCQDISVNGNGAGINGKRSGLYRAMVEVVKRVKPKVFVAENVKGLMTKKHKADLETVISDFSSLGYTVRYDLYNSADYGVPQTRERVLIVGTLPDMEEFVPPEALLSKDSYVTAVEALSDLEPLAEDPSFNHIWSKANRSPEQGDRRLKRDRAGYTIRAECHGNIQWHYSLPRRMSMREAARIQSFPDSFIFKSKLRETERQVGNAVPPVLAWHVASKIKSLLE